MNKAKARATRLATVACVLGLIGCSGGSGGSASSGSGQRYVGGGNAVHRYEIVAQLEMVAPNQDQFLIKATLPVPPGTYVDGQAEVPLAVVQYPGVTAATQVETVTRYPDAADGASVVEVTARVRRSPKVNPGDTMSLFVVEQAHLPEEMRLTNTTKNMLATPGALTLWSHDVFGNRYKADLFKQVVEQDDNARMLREGPLVRQYALHEVLAPVQEVSGPQGTLDHLMGVHAYVTTFDREDWFLIDLHVHNGMDGLDEDTTLDTAMAELLFRDLTLELPAGWQATTLFDHPSLGNGAVDNGRWALPIVKAQAGGRMHSMPERSRFIRRLAVWRPDARVEAEATLRGGRLAYCRDGVSPSGTKLWSWWNEETARWYPQAHRLPNLDHVGQSAIEAEVVGDWMQFGGQLSNGDGGNYPFIAAAQGWAQPWGVEYGGMTGGDEIWITDGMKALIAGRPEGYRMAQLEMRCYADRQPTALYGVEGDPTRVEDLLVTEGFGAPYVNLSFFVKPLSDPFGFDDAPTFQIAAAEAQGLVPGYREALKAWMPIDYAHYIRYTRNLKSIVWMTGDSLAQDQLLAAAETFRLGFHEHNNDAYGNAQVSGLRKRMNYVAEHPGQGFDFARGEGWGVDANVAAYLIGDDETRERLYPWFETVADTVEAGQSTCTGNVMALYVGTKVFNGAYRIRNTAHASFADNALRGMQKSVFADVEPNRAQRLADVIVGNAQAQASAPYFDDAAGMPYSYLGVTPSDPNEPDFCFNIPNEALPQYYTGVEYLSSFAYAYEETGDDLFLFRAAQMSGGGDLRTRLEQRGLNKLGQFSALLATVQLDAEP